MAFQRFIEIHEIKYFKEDIEKMDMKQIKTICSFLGKENDLRFIQSCCNENFSYLIDNLIAKI